MNVIDRDFFNLVVLNAPMAQVTDAFAGLYHPVLAHPTPLIFPGQPYRREAGDSPLILWSPLCAPEITAFMPGVACGDDFVVSYAHDQFGFSLASVRSTAHDCVDSINEFMIYEGKGPKIRRMVRTMNGDPNWNFYTEGEPLPFENMQAYKARRIRDRFNREMLLSYLEHWGAPIRSADFWESAEDAVTLVRTRHGHPEPAPIL